MSTRGPETGRARRREAIAASIAVLALLGLGACSSAVEPSPVTSATATVAQPNATPDPRPTTLAEGAATPSASGEANPTTVPTPQGAAIASPDLTDEHETEAVMQLSIAGQTVPLTPADNSSVDALRERLADGPITLQMSDYGGMEKVGPLGFDLPTNDVRITTAPGDVILYQGGALVIYYGPNTWSFTRLGRLEGLSQAELEDLLSAGGGDITVTLSLG